MRGFGASLIVVLLLLWVGWYNSERLATGILRDQLSASGFELGALALSRPMPSGVKLARLEVSSESMDVEIDQLDLTLLLEGKIHLDVKRVLVTLVSVADDDPQTLIALWEQVQDLLPVMPYSGQIKELIVCQAAQCESMTLGWRKNIAQFDVHLAVPAQHFIADLRYTDWWQVDWLLDDAHALGTFVIEPSGDSFSLSGQGYSELNMKLEDSFLEDLLIEDPALQEVGIKGLRGDVTNASFSFNALVSQQAFATTILSSLKANGKVAIETDWALSTDEVRAYSMGKHEIGFSYGAETATVSIVEHPLINMDSLAFDSAAFQIDGINECRFELSLSEFELTSVQCDLDKVAISASIDDYTTHILVSDIEVRQSIGLYDLQGRTNVRGLISGSEVLSVEAIFSLEDNIASVEFAESSEVWGSAIAFIASHNMIDGVGTFNTGFTGKLRHLLGPAREFADAEVVSVVENSRGQFTVSSNGQWLFPAAAEGDLEFKNLELQHKTVVSLSQFSIDYDGYAAEGGALDVTFAGWPAIVGDVTIGVPSLSVGIEVKSLDLGFQIYVEPLNNIATLRGTQFGMELLGGSIDSQQFGYDIATGNGAALLSMDKLALSEILALQRQDFTCSGLVSGSVPVQISAGNLTVDGASIVAEAPGGFVRYQPDPSVTTLGQQNEGLAVVLEAMTDFQYHTLAASVDYSEEGLMIARTKIKGANPQYQGGREVHLNLSVEENVRTLLESLRLGAGLAEKIGEKTSIRP
ncbi:MAG: hypothetical protein ACI9W1_002795 [Candidatus Azotimanducaceae bacterium]|jgi:hypothetical protein